jgi:uncharacterized protein with PIN domain
MLARIRFHRDEHVDPAIAEGLRRYGIDVTTTVEAHLRTEEDDVQLAFANAEGRVIVTHDNDYLRFNAQGLPHPGMAYCPPPEPQYWSHRPDACPYVGDHDP